MNKRHKHADVIHAWANGEEIEHLDEQGWFVWDSSFGFTPDFNCGNWRIKPKIVKREGWVNVYKALSGYPMAQVFDTEEKAMNAEDPLKLRIACIRIEWEEDSHD